MNVDEDDYMEEWHKTKELRGTFHYFGKLWSSMNDD